MKSKIKTEQTSFTFDELPLPVLIYRKDNGVVLNYNQEARKVLRLTASRGKDLNISAIRPVKLPVFSNRSKSFTNYGSVLHKTSKGEEIYKIVLSKSLKWQGINCFVDFLQ